jgi:hypothetical protein
MSRTNARRGVIALAALLAVSAAFAFKGRKSMVDFAVNYQAGDRIRHGETLYRLQDEHYQFKYSPSCALAYLPLSLLPFPAAKAVWFGLVAAASAAMFFLSRRIVASLRPERAGAATGLAGLVLARFMLREAGLGQVNALLTAGLLGLTLLLIRDDADRNARKATAAGLLWGAALALKPYAAIFLPYLILKKKWRSLGAGLSVLAFSLILPSVFYGFSGNLAVHREWIAGLSESTPRLLTSQDNVSLLASLMKWTGDFSFSRSAYALVVLALAAAVFFFVRRGRRLRSPLPAESGLLLLLIPLISPLGWDYTFLSAILAASIVVAFFDDFPSAGRIFLAGNFAVIGLSFYDLMGPKAYAAFMSGSVLTVPFLVLAGALFFLRFSGKA